MASQSRLISGGVNYYIEGGGSYTGSGTPWTVVTTSPYEYAMNEVAGQKYTLQAALRQEVYGGGPPFRNGQTLVYDSYGNVTEQITIQCRASSHDNAVFLLRQLRQILNTALFTAPCIFAFQPNGATNAVYYEIYGADVQEDPRFTNDEDKNSASGRALVRAVVTWRRSPHGGSASLATLFTNTTFTNNGSGNVASLGTLAGDLTYEGSPLNVKVDGPGSSSFISMGTLWLASASSRVKTTHAAVMSTTTTQQNDTTDAIVATPLLANAGLSIALLLRFSSVTAGNKATFGCFWYLDGGGSSHPVTPITPMQPFPVTTGTTMLLMGVFPLTGQRIPVTTSLTLNLSFILHSIDGTSVGCTVDYSETIFCYTMAQFTTSAGTYGSASNAAQLYSTTAQNLNGVAWLPMEPPIAYSGVNGNPPPFFVETVRGRLPRAYSGASLHAAWIKVDGSHTTTDTTRITAQHAPLWQSLRGAN